MRKRQRFKLPSLRKKKKYDFLKNYKDSRDHILNMCERICKDIYHKKGNVELLYMTMVSLNAIDNAIIHDNNLSMRDRIEIWGSDDAA